MSTSQGEGERFLPGRMTGETALEHQHRYLFACQLAAGRVVLDIACGEGYGSALLAREAREVIGVDIDRDVVEHAQRKYVAGMPTGRLRYAVGDCAAIPLPDASVDLVVSFETIEHHGLHDEMLLEVRRVLRPGGLLLISTPDRREYSELPGLRNPFHVKELYADEFRALLGRHFASLRCWRQRVVAGSWMLPAGEAGTLQFFDADEPAPAQAALPHAPYVIALAGDGELPAMQAGLLAQDLARLATPMLVEPYRRINELVRAVAAPGSSVLRRHLDAPWYRVQNPDLAAADFDRFAHWMSNGAAECRLVSPDLPRLVEELIAERLDAHAADHTAAAIDTASWQALLERVEQAIDAKGDEVAQEAFTALQSLRQGVADQAAQIGGQQAEAIRASRVAIEELGRQVLHRMGQIEAALVESWAELSATHAGHHAAIAALQRQHDLRVEQAERSVAEKLAAERQLHAEALAQLRQRQEEDRSAATRQHERQFFLESELSECRRQLAAALEQVAGVATAAAADRSSFGHELQSRDSRLALLQAELEALRSSRSWRWTAPLRGLILRLGGHRSNAPQPSDNGSS